MSLDNVRVPVRVLHVVGGLNRAGAETALVHVAKHLDRENFRFTFVVHSDQPNDYDEEVHRLGMEILVCPSYQRPWRYAHELLDVIRQHGPFDIVHSHVHTYSGWIMLLSALADVPVRVAHSHTCRPELRAHASPGHRLYFAAMAGLIRAFATKGLAVSEEAAAGLFGATWRDDPRWQVMHPGIDLNPFREEWNREEVKIELGIPADAWVIGQVGRFVEVKNQAFSLEVLRHLAPTQHAYLLLVGEGPLRQDVEARARALGIADRVVFAGLRADIPRLLKGCVDVLMLPSLYEGLAIVGLEAQAAGVPVLTSDAVPGELGVVEGLVRHLSLQEPASAWAEELVELSARPRLSPQQCLTTMERSDFNIQTMVRSLEALYSSLTSAKPAHG